MIKNMVRKICNTITDISERSNRNNRVHIEEQENIRHFQRCIRFARGNGIDGDILEFGVSMGSSLAIIDNIAQTFRNPEAGFQFRIFGFDSFEGMPEPHGIDLETHVGEDTKAVSFDKGAFKSTKSNTLNHLKVKGADISKIKLIEGYFDETLTDDLRTTHNLEKASLINIDCDTYESTVPVLVWCKPLLIQGTIISFDDWFCYEGKTNRGEQRAFHEFLSENSQFKASFYSDYSWHGRAFIIHTNNDQNHSPFTVAIS